MPRGGYQKPSNPAPVSGPGKLSRRTDGGPTQAPKLIPSGGKYGERKALAEQQAAAPMAGNPIPPMAAPKVAAPVTPVTNLFAPTERPDEPVTAGAPVGAGRTPAPQFADRLAMINKYMPALQQMEATAPEGFKMFMNSVRNIAGEVQ